MRGPLTLGALLVPLWSSPLVGALTVDTPVNVKVPRGELLLFDPMISAQSRFGSILGHGGYGMDLGANQRPHIATLASTRSADALLSLDVTVPDGSDRTVSHVGMPCYLFPLPFPTAAALIKASCYATCQCLLSHCLSTFFFRCLSQSSSPVLVANHRLSGHTCAPVVPSLQNLRGWHTMWCPQHHREWRSPFLCFARRRLFHRR